LRFCYENGTKDIIKSFFDAGVRACPCGSQASQFGSWAYAGRAGLAGSTSRPTPRILCGPTGWPTEPGLIATPRFDDLIRIYQRW